MYRLPLFWLFIVMTYIFSPVLAYIYKHIILLNIKIHIINCSSTQIFIKTLREKKKMSFVTCPEDLKKKEGGWGVGGEWEDRGWKLSKELIIVLSWLGRESSFGLKGRR